LEHGDALGEGGGKVEFPAHGALGDGGDLGLEAGEVGQLVEAFLTYDGGIHVRDEQFLAPVGGRGDRPVGPGGAGFGLEIGDKFGLKLDVDLALGHGPFNAATLCGRTYAAGGAVREFAGAAAGDEGEDEGHESGEWSWVRETRWELCGLLS